MAELSDFIETHKVRFQQGKDTDPQNALAVCEKAPELEKLLKAAGVPSAQVTTHVSGDLEVSAVRVRPSDFGALEGLKIKVESKKEILTPSIEVKGQYTADEAGKRSQKSEPWLDV